MGIVIFESKIVIAIQIFPRVIYVLLLFFFILFYYIFYFYSYTVTYWPNITQI